MGMMKVGDVVRLKSGGPQMTVTAEYERGFSADRWVTCVWFTDPTDGPRCNDRNFPVDALEAVKEEV